MTLIVVDNLGPLRDDYDAERVCEVLVDALQRSFANKPRTKLQVSPSRYGDSITCYIKLLHERVSYGTVAGNLKLRITNEPLGVYVRVGRGPDFLNPLTDQLLHVVKATTEHELAPTSRINSSALPANPSIPFRPIPGMTDRETEVAHLLARGRTHQQIAEELVIEEGTVGSTLDHIIDRVPLSERPDVVPHTRWRVKFLQDRGYGQPEI